MQTNAAQQLFELEAKAIGAPVRVWRPFPTELSDLLCVEAADGEIGPWIHTRVAIALIRSRSIVRIEGRRSVHVPADTVLLVPERQVFSVRPLDGARLPTSTFLLGSGACRDTVAQAVLPAIVTRSDVVQATLRLVDHIARPVRSVESESVLASLLPSLLEASQPIASVRSNSTATPLFPLRDYLLAHVGEPAPTATLATLSGLTESHCIRAFHYEFGLPPHAYHLRLRLAQACELLARGQSVSTVAYDCGFADQSHLSRKFKEVYGVAPGAWAAAVSDRRSTPTAERARPARKLMSPARREVARQWR